MSRVSYLDPSRPSIDKAPGAELLYGFDWRAWLTAEGVNISSVDVSVASGDVTADPASHAGGIVSVMLRGGTLGTQAQVDCTITTDGSPVQQPVRSLFLRIVPEGA